MPLIAADYALLEDDRSDSVEEAGSPPILVTGDSIQRWLYFKPHGVSEGY